MIDPKMMNRRDGTCGCGNGTRSGTTRTGGCGCHGGIRNTRTNQGCGCGNGARFGYEERMKTAERRSEGKTSCCQMKEQLRKLEFAIVDVTLYLDAYPESDCALAFYHKLLEERDCLRKKINAECGPLTIYENTSESRWDWVDGPWPWHHDAN